ncbi:MAG: MATE family efflux transporter, partial [Eubacteriales bacterium]|nr:MATE family efflux transporter [Eubacteriales bacterium]
MQQDMTTGRITPIILRFMLPLFAGNIFQQFYSMADTVIVGRFLGAAALAAVGSTSTVSFLLLGFAMGLATGFTVLTSQRFGAG